MVQSNVNKALSLAALGMWVFPVHPTSKQPLTPNGLLDAVNSPDEIRAFWTRWDKAQVGVVAGKSGLCILDIDYKKNEDGSVAVDGYDSLDSAWLDVPETFSYDSLSGLGRHKVYAAPEDKILNGTSNYRGMAGVDRRAGSSYVLWAGPVPASYKEFTLAPDWLCDESKVRTSGVYEGDVLSWYKSLEPGDPNVLVRAAIERAKTEFRDRGNDADHSWIVSKQFEAVRLGAEGNPGVEELLSVLEEATLNRSGSHSRTPDEFAHEFAEALASGIKKYGEAIALRKDMPQYSLSLVPPQVPDRLVTGDPGDRELFSQLLVNLVRYEPDDYKVLSILWNAPTVRDLSREWGLEFVYKRVLDARAKPEDKIERPTSLQNAESVEKRDLLNDEERQIVADHPTFIDAYVNAATAAKKFPNRTYDTTAAWSLLSMTLGGHAYIPKGKPIGLNLWFIVLGESGTGKSSSDHFLKDCLDGILAGGETYYNLGANSSPEGMHEALLARNGLPSMVHHDEASDFFDNLKKKDWMSTLKDSLSKWYEGYVDPMQKVRLKENRGKSAKTSMGLYMLATPDRLLGLVDLSMFETGFLARMNWAWAPPNPDEEAKYKATLTTEMHHGIDPGVRTLVADLLELREHLPEDPFSVSATPEAIKRLVKAHKAMDAFAMQEERYGATEPAVTRLGRETIWKCAALLAIYRGDHVINETDALTAIYYAEDWFNTLFRVVNAAGEGDFNRDVNEIEEYIAQHPNGVTLPSLYNRFRSMITKSPRELDDRVTFAVASGRVRRDPQEDGRVRYFVNE